MSQIIECVPNFSEGRDPQVIERIADEIRSVDGVKLLDIDPGKATNRTVMTFVGEPARVVEAAFRAIKKAAELIDMSKHSGEHPRMGATDVCPLVPVAGITMDECVEWAKKLGKRVGEELSVPVYLYEYAASSPQRQNLAEIRSGEYEGLAAKIIKPEWKPDFGPATFHAKAGATVIGARNFLVAYNINLNSTSTRRANAIAFDVRERGRPKRKGDALTGEIELDAHGEQIWIPGTLKSVKAIGWFIEEYGVAQISMNLTDITVTSVHQAFEEVCRKADERGIRVTGSELVGLIPLSAMLDAGRYFLEKQQRSTGVPDGELIKIAIKSLGLDELKPFDPPKRIIEYLINEDDKLLADLTVRGFADETSSESPAPGGGSVAALAGSLGVALGTMVANLSSHKRGWDEKWKFYSDWAAKGQQVKNRLVQLIDEDTRAFNLIMDAFQLPNQSEEDKARRSEAIQEATKKAALVPWEVMQVSFSALEVLKAMAENGMKSSVSDIGVGAWCVRTAVEGAFLNVKINVSGLKDRAFADDLLQKGNALQQNTIRLVEEILKTVEEKIG